MLARKKNGGSPLKNAGEDVSHRIWFETCYSPKKIKDY